MYPSFVSEIFFSFRREKYQNKNIHLSK